MEQRAIPPLEVGATLGRAFALIGHFPVKIFGVALVFGAIPMLALRYLLGQPTHGLPTALYSLELQFCTVIIHTVVAGLLAGSATKGEAGIGSGLRRLPQLIAAGLLKAVGCLLAALCLLIPSFFVITRWSVIGAIVASEDISFSQAFGRSSELSEGARLGILGLLLLSGVGESLLMTAGMLLLIPLIGIEAAVQDFSLQPAALAIRVLRETLTIGFAGALQCALFVQLRERRDGPRANELSEIFA